MNLNQITPMLVLSMGMDDLMHHSATVRILREEYERHSIEFPDALKMLEARLHERIKQWRCDNLEMRLKRAKIQMEGFKTADERQLELAGEIKRLTEDLAAIGKEKR